MSAFDQLRALPLTSKLAPTPQNGPHYFVKIKNVRGEEEILGDPKATRALVALMNQHAVIGGAAAHWGGPSAFAEIMASIHAIMFRDKNKNWHEEYNFVNDAGHAENGIYALRANYGFDGLEFKDLKKFRSIESKLTGHGEAHLNPEGVYISNGPLGSGIGQAQGLSMADNILGNKRTTICAISDGGSMEGEAKEAFAAIPGFSKKGNLNPFVLIVSDNNTKLSGRISEDSFDMGPTFSSFESLGWELSVCEDGHDLETVHHTIETAIYKAQNDPHTPQVIVAKTIKGYGVKATEESSSGGHGYPLKAYDPKLEEFIQEIYKGKSPSEFVTWAREILGEKDAQKPSTPSKSKGPKKEKVQPGFARACIEAAKKDLPVFSVSADLQGSTGIKAFHQEFPGRWCDVGVAEANMISTAIGLSKQGLIPVVDTFAQFGTSKGNLPLIMAGLSEGPVIALFSHTGMQDAADGASHQSTTYLALTMAIPHVVTVCCSCSSEAKAYMEAAIDNFLKARKKNQTPESVIFFFGRETHPEAYSSKVSYQWGRPQVLKKGNDGALVATGPMVPKALEASELLESEGVNVSVINHPFVNRVDLPSFETILKENNNKILTIEDHQETAGMGTHLVASLQNQGFSFQSKVLGLGGDFGQSAYKADHLYKAKGLSAKSIAKAFKGF